MTEAGVSIEQRPASREGRIRIIANEHEIKPLPVDLIRADGTLDFYDDIQKLFRPVFDAGNLAVQCGRWIGYIPLNDRYALEVNSRVPIHNLERLVRLAIGYSPQILKKYSRTFGVSPEQPSSLMDVLSDQLLTTIDRIWSVGLLKGYEEVERISSSPAGRLKPFESAWRTKKAGRPVATSSAYRRTQDVGANRVLRAALEILLKHYLQFPGGLPQRKRIKTIQNALAHLEAVRKASKSESSRTAIDRYIKRLPSFHAHYAQALMMSQTLIDAMGPAIRDNASGLRLSTILIDMSKVFEEYVRRMLTACMSHLDDVEVRDGNKGGSGGAKERLFEAIRQGLENPSVTPDIVIMSRGQPALIIDTKYKAPQAIPDRSDVNQVISYGARYQCSKVMVLYAARSEGTNSVEMVGRIGSQTLYTGQIDLGAADIVAEESMFCHATSLLIETGACG